MLKANEIASLIDISAVQANSTLNDVQHIISAAQKHRFICVFSLPGFLTTVFNELSDDKDIKIGGVVGFPSGGESLSMKLAQAQELRDMGCDEIDMVMNIGKLKSGLTEDVLSEIIAIKELIAPTPLKVIIEVNHLTDEEITLASQLIVKAQAAFIKTGTGWAGPTSLDHIRTIKKAVGDVIPLKVAGGVRDLTTLITMYDMGVSRFGIGYKAAIEIMDEALRQEAQ